MAGRCASLVNGSTTVQPQPGPRRSLVLQSSGNAGRPGFVSAGRPPAVLCASADQDRSFCDAARSTLRLERRRKLGTRSAALDLAIAPAAPSHDRAHEVWEATLRAGDAFYRFTRPHTLIGTAVSVFSVSLLALRGPADFSWPAFAGLLQALVPALLMNISIVGLNQVYDVEIDKINKPELPLAAGLMSIPAAVAIVAATGAAALALGASAGSLPLMVTLVGSLGLGIAYSTDLPLLRWKQHPLAAAACIFVVRAVLVQAGFYLHMRTVVLGAPAAWSRPLAFVTAFMCLFSVVIALFKDIPDVAGDSLAGIKTASVRMGVPTVFRCCMAILTIAYVLAMVVGASSPLLWSRVMAVGVHAALLAMLWWRAQQARDGDCASSNAP